MDAPCDLVLENVSLPDNTVADVSITRKKVSHIGASGPCSLRIDCTGHIVIPAGIDMHVHMRGGIQSAKEDWKSGSISALSGGVTVVVDQPNTIPPLTNPHAFSARVRDAASHSLCSFAINGGVNEDADLEGLWECGAMSFGEIFCASSTYGPAIAAETLTSALSSIKSFDGLATIHAEDIEVPNAPDLVAHSYARPPEGEIRAVKGVQRANRNKCRLHFCHMSSTGALMAASGIGSTEVTPHHLLLSFESMSDKNPFGKVNPPLRSEDERRRLWENWDLIDIIASDHAPHTRSEKQVGFSDAPSGIPGVETMIPLLMAQVLMGKCSLWSLVEKSCIRPAAILGIPQAGFFPGARADFAVFGKNMTRVDADNLHSKARWTPFQDFNAVFPRTVIMGGVPVFHKGDYSPGTPVWYHGRGYIPGRQS